MIIYGSLDENQNGVAYEGYFLKGKRHGKGVMIYSDGSKYQGMFRGRATPIDDSSSCLLSVDFHVLSQCMEEDQREGTGMYTMTSGNVYVGEFKRNKACGHGVYYYAKGGMYSGEWQDDLFHGKGMYLGNNTKYEVSHALTVTSLLRQQPLYRLILSIGVQLLGPFQTRETAWSRILYDT